MSTELKQSRSVSLNSLILNKNTNKIHSNLEIDSNRYILISIIAITIILIIVVVKMVLRFISGKFRGWAYTNRILNEIDFKSIYIYIWAFYICICIYIRFYMQINKDRNIDWDQSLHLFQPSYLFLYHTPIDQILKYVTF